MPYCLCAFPCRLSTYYRLNALYEHSVYCHYLKHKSFIFPLITCQIRCINILSFS
nr:MAG TPA: hypothetical protein [Caudoviricetes sp.]